MFPAQRIKFKNPEKSFTVQKVTFHFNIEAYFSFSLASTI
jgi:hypothetical protein